MKTILFYVFKFAPLAGMCVGLFFLAHRTLHYFQLESYQFAGYIKTIRRQFRRVVTPCAEYAAVCAALLILYRNLYMIPGIQPDGASGALLLPQFLLDAGIGLLCAAAGYMIAKLNDKTKEKKPFAKTPRMKRLYAALLLVFIAAFALIFALNGLPETNIWFFALPLFLPLLVALAAVIALPGEKIINRLYFKDAEKKLMRHEKLIRIGITGSYGKTSVKFILLQILSQKFNVLATPASFNTPMGVTRVIRERLTPAHQVFIGEMGARHVGDIQELCRLVHPSIGILTSVGPQHLDTFGSIERIAKTKYELIDALPADGLAVFLDDGGIVTGLYEKTCKPRLLVGKEGADAWADDVRVGPLGSAFMLHIKGENPFPCETKLLGRHNIRNILLASTVAKALGMSARQISLGIASLEPVEHRMQIVSTAGGVTVIDDAFNTNPRSSKEALAVLKSFPGRRIIVTPGMVELGAEEAKYNAEFGRAMASCVDIAVLVGKKHASPIREGLEAEGFDQAAIHAVDSLAEAVEYLNTIRQTGDVILYENDLPDHYSEK